MGGYLPVEIKRNEEGQSFFADVRVINIVTRWPGSDSVKNLPRSSPITVLRNIRNSNVFNS